MCDDEAMDHFLSGFVDELTKIAKSDSDGMGKGQAAAIAAAGASPFAGMIGQERLRHDPHRNKSIQRFSSIDALSRKAQPGDIILTSKKKSIWKSTQSPLSGSEFYHVQPVVGRKGGRGTTASAGNWSNKDYQQLSRKDFAKELETIGKEMKAEKYKDVLLLRPKTKLSKSQLKTFIAQNLDRSRTEYDTTRAVKAWAKDIFVPKIVPKSILDKAKGITTIRYRKIKDPNTGKSVRRPVMCKGNVCSTMPAQAFEKATGKRVVRGKLSKDVMPSDFLRSKEMSPVGAVIKETKGISRMKPHLIRGAAGLGLAGAAYSATENPSVAAGVAGAAGGSAAHKKYLEMKGKKLGLSPKQIAQSKPNLMRTIDDVMNAETPKAGRKAFATSLRKSLPAKAIGAGLAFATARHLMKRRKKSSSSAST